MALGTILITATPTPSGMVSSKYRDGDDSEATPPTDPQIGQPIVLNSTDVDIPLVTASTGGTAPLAYELSLSTTSAIAGFSVTDADADFSGDGVYSATGLTEETQYWVRLACVDADSRRSGYSGTFTFTTSAAGGGDVTAPTAPTSLAATSTTAGQASLTWTNGTDAVGIAYTDVLRGNSVGGVPTNDGTVIDTVTGTGSAYTDVSAPAGSQVFYRVQHRDAAGNVSAQSDRVFVTIASVPASNRKWEPGHGVKVADDSGSPSDPATQQAGMAKLADSAYLTFAEVRLRWGRLNTVGSTYDWSVLDSHLAKLATYGAKCGLHISYKAFNSTQTYVAPTDLALEPTSFGYMAPLWRAAAMNQFITFIQALAARYDNDQRVEYVTWSETATGVVRPAAPDYSAAAYAAQLKRLYVAAGAAFTNTVVNININSLSGELVGLLDQAWASGLGFSTPDAVDTNAVKLWRGESITTETPTQSYSGLQSHAEVVSSPVLGGKDDNGPPSNVINWAQTNKVTHLSWITFGTGVNSWANCVAAIAADPLLYTTAPSN